MKPTPVLKILLLFFAAISQAATVSGTVQVERADRSEVVVWLQSMTANAAPLVPRRVRMLQKDKRFQPHLLTVSTGSTVDFPNLDPIFHNAFSNFNGQIFDIGLYPPGKSRSITFKNPGVVHVFCNIHPTMAAVIVVVDSQHFAVTDASGRFTLDGVPPGDYRLEFYNERSTAEVLHRAAIVVTLHDGAQTLAPIVLSEAGYIAAPHANKYGRPYPPGAGDPSSYSPNQ